DTTDAPGKGLADITGLDKFASKWSTEDWVICAQGVWECLNKEDIKRDRRDLANDPKGYISDVLGLDEWKRRWEGIKRIDLTGQWRDFTDDPGGYFDRKWNFTKERIGSWWADISRTPGKCPPTSCPFRSEEHTSELQSRENLVCRLPLEKKKNITDF